METKPCRVCHIVKPLSDFPPHRSIQHGTDTRCRNCKNVYQREWTSKHREQVRASFKKHYAKNRAAILESQRLRRIRDKDKIRAKNKRYVQHIRYEILSHYGGDSPKCACCGETIIEFLAIDHIDGGGSQHRKQIRKEGHSMYLWLRRENFPEGFQVLCHNCNMAKGFYGVCPHQQIKGD